VVVECNKISVQGNRVIKSMLAKAKCAYRNYDDHSQLSVVTI